MNDFFEKLASTPKRSESSDHLQLLAKRAAGMYVNKEADSLNTAITSALRGESLNKEQVRRVSEMANQATWKTMFIEGKDNNASFDPANADTVLEGLSGKAEEAAAPVTDYLQDPPKDAPDSEALEQAFSTESKEDYQKLNPSGEAEEAYHKAASALDVARLGTDQLEGDLHTLSEEFYSHVKQAHLRDDCGILQIAKAVGASIDSSKFASSIMKSASSRLAKEGVRVREEDELAKTASPLIVNTEHPLIVTAAKLEKVARAYVRARAAHRDLDEQVRNPARYLYR